MPSSRADWKHQRICPAKINLHLGIGTLDPSQPLHRVCTLMQAVYLQEKQVGDFQQAGDLLTVEFSAMSVPGRAAIFLTAEPAPCAAQDNLVYRAALQFCSHFSTDRWPQEIHFYLQKRIPQQAGLGGGSSNAAAALLLLNELLPPYSGAPALPLPKLHEIAAQLGSDVPFFLQDFSQQSLAWGTEYGQKIIPVTPELASQIEQLEQASQLWLLKPVGVSCPTKEMYHTLDSRQKTGGLLEKIRLQSYSQSYLKPYLQLEQQLKQLFAESPQLGLASLRSIFYNDFWAAILESAAEDPGTKSGLLASLSEYLYSLAASWVALSGSGAALFAWFPAELEQAEIVQRLAAFPGGPLEIFPAIPACCFAQSVSC